MPGASCRRPAQTRRRITTAETALRTAQALAKKKGVTLTGEALDTHAYKEQQYDRLADSVRKSLDMEWIYRIMEGKA